MKYLALLQLMSGKMPAEGSEFSENFGQKLKNFNKKQLHCEKCSQEFKSNRAVAARVKVHCFSRLYICGRNADAMRTQYGCIAMK